MRPSVRVPVEPAPTIPFNLRIGVAYAPRVQTPPFLAFACVETSPGQFAIYGYDDAEGVVLFSGASLVEAWHRFAQHLRLDLAP